MTYREAVDCIDKVLDSDYHYDESLGYNLTSDDIDWLETARKALEHQIPAFVSCPKGWQGVRDTRYYCPYCKKAARRYEEFCHNCGQALRYPKEKYDKEKNKIILVWE